MMMLDDDSKEKCCLSQIILDLLHQKTNKNQYARCFVDIYSA